MADEQGEQSQAKPQTKTIYDVSLGSIIVKNFFAGMSRAAGAIFVYLVLGGIIYYFSITYILPQVQRLIPASIPIFGPSANLYQSSTDGNQSNYSLTPEQFDEALEALQQYNRDQSR